MVTMTHAKFYFNWLMLTSTFGIWASVPPGPGERLKRLGLIELKLKSNRSGSVLQTSKSHTSKTLIPTPKPSNMPGDFGGCTHRGTR